MIGNKSDFGIGMTSLELRDTLERLSVEALIKKFCSSISRVRKCKNNLLKKI